MDQNEMSMNFFVRLFALSVEVQRYFYKPNAMLQFILTKVIRYLTTILHEPDQISYEVRSLGTLFFFNGTKYIERGKKIVE